MGGGSITTTEVHAHNAAVNGLATDSGGDRLCSCSNDGFVRVWDAVKMECHREIDVCGGAVKVVACRANLLFFGGHDGVVYQTSMDHEHGSPPLRYRSTRCVGAVMSLCFIGDVQLEPVLLRGQPGTAVLEDGMHESSNKK